MLFLIQLPEFNVAGINSKKSPFEDGTSIQAAEQPHIYKQKGVKASRKIASSKSTRKTSKVAELSHFPDKEPRVKLREAID